jgi:hypothetical protein
MTKPSTRMKKQRRGKIMKILGWILIALQVMSLMGGMPSAPGGGYAIGYYIGYFLPGIIGVILLMKANKKKQENEEQN